MSCLLLFTLQRQLLFPAGVEPPSLDRAGLTGLMERATIATADGLALLSWYHPPATAGAPLVILFHGNGGTIEIRAAKARTYIDAGLGVLLLEYRGYGGNPGSPSEAGLYADGRAAMAFAASQRIKPDRVILIGESLGTGVAVHMAVEALWLPGAGHGAIGQYAVDAAVLDFLKRNGMVRSGKTAEDAGG